MSALNLVLLGTGRASAAVTYRTVALTGDPAPGAGLGVVYDELFNPVLNGDGQTAFESFLTGTGVDTTNNFGIWSEGSGSLNLIAREDDHAPGTEPGTVYFFLGRPTLNDTGQVAFEGGITGFGTNSSIWSGGSGSLSLVAREGSAAPGTELGLVFGGVFSSPVFNAAGQTAFRASLNGEGVDGTNDKGIWSEGSGSLSLVAREGDAAPGTGPGVVFSNLSVFRPVLNGAGQTAFLSFLSGPGVDTTNERSIWSEGSGSLSLIAREGDAAPGTEPGVVYQGFGFPGLNGAGQTAFFGLLTGTGVDITNNNGIWSEGGGTLHLVARAGDAAHDTEAGVVYSGFGNPALTVTGQTVFRGDLTGTGVDSTNNLGIWSESSGSFSLVVRTGDAAPGTEPGVVFSFVSTPEFNDTGQTAFQGFLTGPGVDDINDRGIWATDPNGLLTIITREGDLFDVNDDPLIDDFRTISLIHLVTGSLGEDGQATSFNDAGQLALKLGFIDGSEGIFVASTRLAGDLNGNGFVDILDLNIVLANWNTDGSADPRADTDGNGLIDILDLNAVLTDWNQGTPPAGTAIPEPASGLLLAFGLSSIAVCRSRRR